jgi:hypothetical protein
MRGNSQSGQGGSDEILVECVDGRGAFESGVPGVVQSVQDPEALIKDTWVDGE